MAEEKNARIVIASVLKPVTDVRMFSKLAKTFASSGYEVHCIGFGKACGAEDSVTLHGTGLYRRISFARWTASWRVLRITLSLRPTHYIITTHELLFSAFLIRQLTGARIIYDVQENYRMNILHTSAFPPFIKNFVAWWVRFKESTFALSVDHFLLAEKVYAEELPFVRNKFTIVENKSRRPANPRKRNTGDSFKLLFTGIMAESTGVFIAIELASLLHKTEPRIQLSLVGFAPMTSVLKKMKKLLEENPFISIVGGDRPVTHDVITSAIEHADFGIISYPTNPSTAGRIPTKLEEYIAHRLPILLIDHQPWVKITQQFDASAVFSYPFNDVEGLLHQMKTANFYSKAGPLTYWEDHEKGLLKAVLKDFGRL